MSVESMDTSNLYTVQVILVVFKFIPPYSEGTGDFGMLPAFVDISIFQDTTVKIQIKGRKKA